VSERDKTAEVPEVPEVCLSVRDLTFSYDAEKAPVLRGIHFTVCKGEYVAVLGANGSGKSTLLRCINTILQPPEGTVISHCTMGTVLQNPDDQIISSIVEEDIAFGPENLDLPKEEIERRVEGALAACNLLHLRNRAAQFLSGGERQRLALAGALAMDAQLILLDEAVSMLDPQGRDDFLLLLEKLNKAGKTIITVTHALEDLFPRGVSPCKRCLVLNEGNLVYDGSPFDLLPINNAGGRLEAWGFAIPEPVKALRLLSRLYPGFTARSLDSGEAAAALRPFIPESLRQAWLGRGDADAANVNENTDKANAANTNALEFHSVSHEYWGTTQGINAVSFAVPAGSSVALIGKSGSGKSTVLKHINALLLPRDGTVLVQGRDTLDSKTNLGLLRQRAALAVQSPESALFETYVADDIAFGPKNAGIGGTALRSRVKDAMEETGLSFEQFADRETRTLSGGEKRRAAIAGAAALDSNILLLDEPLAALDGIHRQKILSLIGNRRRGKTIIVTTHSMETASLFDYIGVMIDGTMAAFGPPRQIFGPLWNPRWGLALPWTCAFARALSANTVPLGAEELPDMFKNTPKNRLPKNRNSAADFYAGHKACVRGRRRKTGLEFFRTFTAGDHPPSPLRNLRGETKLALLLLFFTAVIAGPPLLFAPVILALVLAAGAAAGRAGPRRLLRGLRPLAPWLGIIVAVQALYTSALDTSAELFHLWRVGVTVTELLRALSLVMRVAAIMSLLSLYSAVTPLRETMRAINGVLGRLSRFGFPARDLCLAIGIALRFVPVLSEEAERIVSAQLSRGGKIRQTFSIIVPLFLRALERAETLAEAMVLRGYH
jgi:energy-coupling factor transport system ATP-binding protein